MRLLDTNVLVYSRQPSSPFHQWAVDQIADAVSDQGAALSAVSLAELCAEPGIDSAAVASAVLSFGVEILDIPAAASEPYRSYCQSRKEQSGKDAPKTPLPDFFIGAHAEMLDMDLVTNDAARFRTYFPSVRLLTPQSQ